MRAIFVADLHSDKKQYDELAQLIKKNEVDLLLIGGDLVEYSSDMATQVQFMEQFFVNFIKSISVPVWIIPGNIEWTGTVKYYEELAKRQWISLLSLEPLKFNGLKFSGYAYCNPTPFSRKDFEKRDLKNDKHDSEKAIFISDVEGILVEQKRGFLNELPSIEDDLVQLVDSGIWIMHAPPYETHLDILKSGDHVGSKAIRKQIEQLQPVLTLHGHIHESPYITNQWVDYIGDTLCINPGRGSNLHAVILNF